MLLAVKTGYVIGVFRSRSIVKQLFTLSQNCWLFYHSIIIVLLESVNKLFARCG